VAADSPEPGSRRPLVVPIDGTMQHILIAAGSGASRLRVDARVPG